MAAEGMIDQLIDKQVLKDFDDLMSKMNESVAVTLEWVKVLGSVEQKFSNISSFKEYINLMNDMSKIEEVLNKQHERRAKYETEMQKLIERSVKASEAMVSIQKELKDATDKLVELQDKQAKATKTVTEATERQAKVKKELTIEEKALTQRARERERAQVNQIKATKEEEGSLKQLRLELGNLNRAFDSLSKTSREGALGQELKKQIVDITASLNEAEQSTGRFNRNVGNYQNAIMGAIGANKGFISSLSGMFINQNKLNSIQAKTATEMASATTGFQKAGVAAKGFGKQLLALLANPIVAILAGIVGAFMLLKKGIEGNEEASNRLKKVMAPLQAIFDYLKIALQKYTEAIMSVIEFYGKLITATLKLAEKLPIVGKYIKQVNERIEEKNDIVEREIALDNEKRKLIEESAKTEAEIALIRERLSQQDYKNIEEKMSLLQRAIDLEKKQNAERIRIAKEELQLLKDKNKHTASDAELNNKLAEAKAKVFQLEKEGALANLKLNKQLVDANKENLREAIAAAKVQVDIANVTRAAEADNLKKITADTKYSLAERTKAYEEYVKVQSDILKASADISVREAEGDAQKIKLIQVKLADDLRKLNEQAADFRMKEIDALNVRILTAQRKIIDLQINDELEKIKKIADNDKKGYDERANASFEYYYEKEKQLKETLRRELENEELNAEERKAAVAKANSDILKLQEQAAAEQEKILIDSATKQIEIRRDSLKAAEMSDIAVLSEQYAKGLIKKEKYEKQKLEIQKDYAQQSRNAEKDAITESLKVLQQELDRTKVNFPEIDTSAVEAQIDSLKYRLLELSVDTNEAFASVADGQLNLWDSLTKSVAESLNMTEAQLNEFANSMKGVFGSMMDLVQIASEKRIAAYEEEMAILEEKQAKEQDALNNAIMGDEKRAIEQKKLQLQQEAARQGIERKKKAEMKKQAQFEKRWALVQVMINTAVGVMKAAPAIPLMVAIGLMGAVQAAVVAAQSIPAYAKGTDDKGHPKDGYAVVGDGLKHEAIITPQGKIYKTPNKPTLVKLQKGAIVKPDFNRFVSEYTNDVINMSREVTNYNQLEYAELLENNRQQAAILREIAHKTGTKISMNIDRHGFFNSMENENKRKKYLNYEVHAEI